MHGINKGLSFHLLLSGHFEHPWLAVQLLGFGTASPSKGVTHRGQFTHHGLVGMCAWCREDRQMSREHVFPDWLNGVFGTADDAPYDVSWTQGFTGQPDTRRTYGSRVIDQTVKTVCVDCNTGWMSRLEDQARPALTALIRDESRTLTAQDQVTLAAWAAMKAIVAEDLGGRPVATDVQRDAIRLGSGPPRGEPGSRRPIHRDARTPAVRAHPRAGAARSPARGRHGRCLRHRHGGGRPIRLPRPRRRLEQRYHDRTTPTYLDHILATRARGGHVAARCLAQRTRCARAARRDHAGFRGRPGLPGVRLAVQHAGHLSCTTTTSSPKPPGAGTYSGTTTTTALTPDDGTGINSGGSTGSSCGGGTAYVLQTPAADGTSTERGLDLSVVQPGGVKQLSHLELPGDVQRRLCGIVI